MITRIDCSEAGFNEFLLANPQLDGHADLIWQLHAVYSVSYTHLTLPTICSV